ncbi:MAG: hypothetical protein ACFFD4_36455 [Candidatus Odinarchaeota archaeon]
MAEFHDIAKLVDSKELEKKEGILIKDQQFSKFEELNPGYQSPSSASWYSRLADDRNFKSLKSSRVPEDYRPDVLLTKVADEVAASVSRTPRVSGDFGGKIRRGDFVVEGISVLWNPDFYSNEKKLGKHWAAARTADQLRELFAFINTCNDPERLFDKYREHLFLTPEDKSVPFNIVSLYTHLELTGKIYRILKRYSRVIKQDNGVFLEYSGNTAFQKTEITGGRIDKPDSMGKWQFRLVGCEILFPQVISRLQDLNVFRKRMELIRQFSSNGNTKDHVLFFTDDWMYLFAPVEDECRLQDLLKPFLDAGFTIDYAEIEAELGLLVSSKFDLLLEKRKNVPKRHLKLREWSLHRNLVGEIIPPLCDSCQLEQGIERIKGQVSEFLCDSCIDIRESGLPAREFARWEEEGLKAGWLKISLDNKQLDETIERLFTGYVRDHLLFKVVSGNDKEELINSFRDLAVKADFVKDYKQLLKCFSEQIHHLKDGNDKPIFTGETFLFPISDYREFGIFQFFSGEELLAVLDLFAGLVNEYFPGCVDDSPVKLSISLAHVKYPYQAHWRFLSSPVRAINIQVPGSTPFEAGIDQYGALRKTLTKEKGPTSHVLHRLASIKRKTGSNIAVMLEIQDNKKKRGYEPILELLREGLSIEHVLDYHELTS